MAQPQRGPVRTEVSDLRNIVDRLDLLMGASTDASEAGEGLPGTVREQIEHTLSDLTERIGAVERETEELRTLVNHLMTIATWQAKVTATLVGDEGEPEADEAPQPQPQPQRHEATGEPADDAQQALYSGTGAAQPEQHYGEPGASNHGADPRSHEYGDRAGGGHGDPRSRDYGEHAGGGHGDLRSRDYGEQGPGGHADLGSEGFVDRVGQHVDARRGEEPERSRRQAPTTLDDDIDDILGTDREPSSEMGPPPDFGI